MDEYEQILHDRITECLLATRRPAAASSADTHAHESVMRTLSLAASDFRPPWDSWDFEPQTDTLVVEAEAEGSKRQRVSTGWRVPPPPPPPPHRTSSGGQSEVVSEVDKEKAVDTSQQPEDLQKRRGPRGGRNLGYWQDYWSRRNNYKGKNKGKGKGNNE